MVELGRVVRCSLYSAAKVRGSTLTGFGSGRAMAALERAEEEALPPGFGYEWTDLFYQRKSARNTAIRIIP